MAGKKRLSIRERNQAAMNRSILAPAVEESPVTPGAPETVGESGPAAEAVAPAGAGAPAAEHGAGPEIVGEAATEPAAPTAEEAPGWGSGPAAPSPGATVPAAAEQEDHLQPVRSSGRPRKTKAQVLPAGSARLGLYIRRGTMEEAKSAYVADLDNLSDPPSSFARWIAAALDAHTARTAQERATVAAQHPDVVLPVAGAAEGADPNAGVNRAFILPEATIAALEETTVVDRRAGRMQSVSALASEALRAAIAAARERTGGTLPTAPKRLPNKPGR